MDVHGAFFARSGAIEQLIDQILANPYPPSVQAIYNQSRAIGACNTSDRLSEIDHPTLIMVGSKDILLPVAFSEQLARSIRGAELLVLENTGHGMLVESPDSVTGAIPRVSCPARRNKFCSLCDMEATHF